MSLFTLAVLSNAGQQLDALKTHLTNEHEIIFEGSAAIKYAGIESEGAIDGSLRVSLNSQFETIKDSIQTALPELSEAGIESASRCAFMMGAPKELYSNLKQSGIEAAGLEAFSKDEIAKYRTESIMINGATADGTPILNTLYPTIEVGANFAGIEFQLRRYVRINNTVNPMDGSPMDFQRQHIVDAYRDASILDSENNKLFPIVVTGSNEAQFTAAAKVPKSKISGTDWFTAPLKPQTTELNLLGLSRAPGINGTSAHTYNDRIDAGARFSRVYINLGAADFVHAASLSMFNDAQFVRGAKVGSSNDTVMSLDAKGILVPLIDGDVQLKVLKDLGYTHIALSLVVNAKLNLHTGNFTQTYGTPIVTGLFTDGDETNYIDDGGAAIGLAALVPAYVGFTVDATLSSKTLRLEGTRVDTQDLDFTFPMTARPVVTSERAISESDVSDLLDIMGATDTIRRENDAIDHIMTAANELVEMYGENFQGTIDPTAASVPGLTYMRPFAKTESIAVDKLVNSENSSERHSDIQSAVMNLLSDRLMTMLTVSGYLENKRMYTKDRAAKGVFALLTSNTLGRFLYTSGDDRSFGGLEGDIDTKPKVLTTNNKLLDDTIVMVPVSTGGAKTNVFGWGNCYRSSSIVYDVQLTKGDSHKRHLQCQPFYTFVNNAPMVYVLEITGLSAYLATQSAQLTTSV